MKKIVLLLVLALQFAYSQELALVRKDGKFGYITKEGSFAIAPKFSAAKNFSDGLAAAEEKGKWGFIDTKGEWVIAPTFDNAKYFDSGICIVQIKTDWKYINKKGEIQTEAPSTDKLFDFENGIAFFRQVNKVGLINNKFEVVLNPTYDVIRSFEGNYARCAKNGKWGIIDTTGKEVVESIYDEIGTFARNTTWAKKGKVYGIIHDGKFIEIPDADELFNFGPQDFVPAKKDGKIGFVDFEGKWIIRPRFEKVKAFSKDLAPATINGKWGYINTIGAFVIAPSYSDAEVFSEEGLAPVKTDSWGFIDQTGKMVIAERYDISVALFGMFSNQQKGFIDGLARVKLSGKWGFLKPDGSVLGEWFQNAEPFQKI